MPNKKKQRNGFYFFMKYLQKKYAAEGRHFTMVNLPPIAHPLWKGLSPLEREQYEREAKGFKSEMSTGRCASDGIPLQQLQIEEEEENRIHNEMIHGIGELVRVIPATSENFQRVIPQKVFHALTFNILCCTDEYQYIPLEVGAVEYSIAEGIKKCYHKFIYPGPIPTGYTGESKRHSEDTHQIHIYGHESSERDYGLIIQELIDFLNPEFDMEKSLPPVFCLQDNIPQTRGSIEWLAKKSKRMTEAAFMDLRVWDLSYLFLKLREVAGCEHQLPSVAIAEDMLKKNTFDYTTGTRCMFHDDLDIAHCALGYSKRVCYLMSDALCSCFGVSATPDHLPVISHDTKPYEIHIPAMSNFHIDPRNKSGLGRGSHVDLQNSTASTFYNSLDDIEPHDFPRSQSPRILSPLPSSAAAPVRQPQTSSVAQLMSSHLLTSTATVPGTGIGRGRVKKM